MFVKITIREIIFLIWSKKRTFLVTYKLFFILLEPKELMKFKIILKGNMYPYNSYSYNRKFHGPYIHQYDYQTPYYKDVYYNRNYVTKRLPPIIKNVKQHVYVDQPVIINKIPVIHKRKEVVVKKRPPIYDVNHMPTVIEKDVGVDVMPTIEKSHVMPKEVLETPEIVNKGIGVDVMHGIEKEPEVPKEVISEPMSVYGVNGMDKTPVMPQVDDELMYDLDKRVKGFDAKDVMLMKDIKNMRGFKDMNGFEDMKDMMKKGMVDMKDEDFGDYNKKDFDTEEKY